MDGRIAQGDAVQGSGRDSRRVRQRQKPAKALGRAQLRRVARALAFADALRLVSAAEMAVADKQIFARRGDAVLMLRVGMGELQPADGR
jgi:hypothetical protein